MDIPRMLAFAIILLLLLFGVLEYAANAAEEETATKTKKMAGNASLWIGGADPDRRMFDPEEEKVVFSGKAVFEKPNGGLYGSISYTARKEYQDVTEGSAHGTVGYRIPAMRWLAIWGEIGFTLGRDEMTDNDAEQWITRNSRNATLGIGIPFRFQTFKAEPFAEMTYYMLDDVYMPDDVEGKSPSIPTSQMGIRTSLSFSRSVSVSLKGVLHGHGTSDLVEESDLNDGGLIDAAVRISFGKGKQFFFEPRIQYWFGDGKEGEEEQSLIVDENDLVGGLHFGMKF